MNLAAIIDPSHICQDLAATDKHAAIEEMMDCLVAAGRVKDRDGCLKAVMDREAKLSTGMGNGVAIPHGKTNLVGEISAAVGISRAGIDFQSADEVPCHIILLTLSPTAMIGPHIEFLATVTRKLNSETCRQQILDCDSAEEIVGLLSEGVG